MLPDVSAVNVMAKQHRHHLVVALVLGLSFWLLKNYFIFNLQIILGLVCAPFVLKVNRKNHFSWRYVFPFVIFLLGYWYFCTYLLLYLALGCLVLLCIELFIGRNGFLPVLLLIALSPALYYVVNIFTFSLRLELSEQAANMLNMMGMKVTCSGSYFTLPDGFTFNVDKACIGLNMFCTGLFLVVLMVGFAEQKAKKHLGFAALAGITLTAILLLVLTNLLRIAGLVFFRSMPGTLGHECIGIVSLLLYMGLPTYFLIRWMVFKFGKERVVSNGTEYKGFNKKVFFILLLCTVSVLVHYRVSCIKQYLVSDTKVNALVLPGYTKKMQEDHVAEFRKGNHLIYIKPAVKPFQSDHSPELCWRGSGFDLVQFSEKRMGQYTIMTGLLKKGEHLQYTAWWYDNGTDKTVSQWQWRFSGGEPYRIINITTDNMETLENLCREFLGRKLF